MATGQGGRLVAYAVHMLVNVVLVGLVVLAVWNVPPRGAEGTDADAAALEESIGEFEEAVASGARKVGEVTEQQINAYLASRLAQARESRMEGLSGIGIDILAVAIGPEKISLAVSTRWGGIVGKQISYEVEFVPKVRNSRLRFVPLQGCIGKLPLSRAGASWLGRKLGKVFTESRRELGIFERISTFDLGSGKVTIGVN